MPIQVIEQGNKRWIRLKKGIHAPGYSKPPFYVKSDGMGGYVLPKNLGEATDFAYDMTEEFYGQASTSGDV